MRVYRQLERVRRYALDECQKALATARANEARLHKAINDLDHEMHAQVAVLRRDPLLMRYFQHYHERYQERRAALEADLTAAQKVVQAVEDRLREAFAEKKKIEIIAERLALAEQQWLARQLQQQNDELYLSRLHSKLAL